MFIGLSGFIFCEMLVCVFCRFLYWILLFNMYFRSYEYNPGTNSLLVICVTDVFLQFVACCFTFFMVNFDRSAAEISIEDPVSCLDWVPGKGWLPRTPVPPSLPLAPVGLMLLKSHFSRSQSREPGPSGGRLRERAGTGSGSEGWRPWEGVSGFAGGRRPGLLHKVMPGSARLSSKLPENNNNNNKRKHRNVNCSLSLEICEAPTVCRILCRVLGYNYGECTDPLELVRETPSRSKSLHVKWCRNLREKR